MRRWAGGLCALLLWGCDDGVDTPGVEIADAAPRRALDASPIRSDAAPPAAPVDAAPPAPDAALLIDAAPAPLDAAPADEDAAPLAEDAAPPRRRRTPPRRRRPTPCASWCSATSARATQASTAWRPPWAPPAPIAAAAIWP